MVLGLYHTARRGSRRLRQQVLQFPQCFTVDGGRRCRGNATAGNGSNIHCGTSSKPAVSNGSRPQRSTDSAFFLSIVVKIHTVCPYHGCQR